MKRPILFTVFTFLFLTSITLFAYNVIEVFIPKGLELIEGKSFLTTETSMMQVVGQTPVDVSGMFNERGFYKSSSVTYDENEIINDFNGNLMYSFPMFSEKGPGDIYMDLSLNYNGTVNYQVFAADVDWMMNNVMPRYNITASGWIFSINGMAVQMLNFETDFFTRPSTSAASDVYNDEIRLLASGYHVTENIGPIDNTSNQARIMIMRGDGSVLTLKRMPPYNDCDPANDPEDCYIGDFYSENKGDYARAKVEYRERLDNVHPSYWNRKASIMKGDGLTYIYYEYKIQYFDFSLSQGSYVFKPQVFLLVKIIDRFGHTLNINNISPSIGFKGRPQIYKITASWDSPSPDIEFVIGSGNKGFVGVYNHEKGAYKLFTDGFTMYESIGNHRPFPERLENPAGDNIYFEFEEYNRRAVELENPNPHPAPDLFNLNFGENYSGYGESLRRLKSVINYNGGKREYTYMPDEGNELMIDMRPDVAGNKIQSTDSIHTYFGQGRDMFFNNMLNEVKVYDGNELVRREAFEYKYTDNYGDRLYNPVDDRDLYFTTRSIFSEEPELNYNTPTTLRTKTFYRNYKLYDPTYNPRNPDFPGHTKKIWEKFYTTNENELYKRIDYGFLADGVSNSLFYGSFLDTNITENIKGVERVRSFRYVYDTEPLLNSNQRSNNPIIQKTEFDPFRIKTVNSYRIFYDPENTHYLNGKYYPYGGGNVYETTTFYLIGQIDTMEKFYQEVNEIYKETYEYHTTNNDDGYIGQLKEKRIYNSDNYNDYKRIQFKYFIKDTLGIYLYPSGYKPSTEGNLKEIIDPKGNSTKFYYHPVSGEYCSGTTDPPRIIYKKLLYDGSIVQDTSEWVDIRMPTITENIPNEEVSLLSFKEYNRTGNVTHDLNQYLYLTEFTYDGLDRLQSASLPYNFDTSQSYDSLAVDTTFIPIEYILDTDGWGFFTKGSINPFRFITWGNKDSLIQGPFTLNIYHEPGGSEGENDTNHLPLMRFNENDTISLSLSDIESAKFEYFPTYLWTIYNNDTSTTNLCLEIQAYKRIVKSTTPYGLDLQQGPGYGKFELPGLIEKVTDCEWLRDNYFDYYQSIDVTDMLRNHLIEEREKLAGFSFNIRTWETPINPHEEYDMYLTWCIKPSYPQGIMPRYWIYDYSPRIKIKGTYRYINSRVIKVYPKATLRYVYDDVNNKTEIYSAFDHQTDKRTEHLFDGFYRIKQSNLYTTTNTYDSTEVMYNYLDLQAKTIDGRGNASKFSYDTLLNLNGTKYQSDDSTIVVNTYQNGLSYHFGSVSGLVNKQKFVDEEGNEFFKYFDAVGNLRREVKYVLSTPSEGQPAPVPVNTDYRYDSLYRVTHVKTPAGKIISYSYDGYGRQSQRTTPDAGTVKYKYDKNDNLRFSQDANQDASSSDLITFRGYDDINRLLYIGEAPIGGGVPNGGWYSLNPDGVASFENYSQYTYYFLTINVYDTLSTAYGGEFSPPDDYYNTINYTKGNLVATAYRTRGTDNWNYKYYRYDVRGRVIKMWHVIYGLETKTIDYTYNSQNQVTYLSYQNGLEEEFKKFRYVYDKAGRLKDVQVFVPIPSEDYYFFTSYEYNQNSQVSKHSFNDDNIHTNYNYNSRNWIVSGLDNSVFRYAITEYYKNGNVKTQALVGNYNNNFSTTGDITINYSYDPSNRLLKADAGATTPTFDLNNTYDYDGNIKTLMRYGSNNNLLDDFNYEYITGTNKLRKVSGTIDQFTYDLNGNMMGDGLQDNYGFKYDCRNLLTEISRLISENETELTRYYYDEAGNRIRKLVLRNWSGGGGGIPDPPNWDDIGNLPIYEPEGEGGDGWSIYKNEYYVRGVGGNTIAEYDWETLQQWNVYGTDNVGKITKDGEEENKYYYLKDHLGSIRAVIDEYNSCVSAQDYDMWGYLLENRTFDIEREKYKFTSKERDEESSYDYFGARYYMSRIGRWGSVDHRHQYHSPYIYCANNPLNIVDVDGYYGYDVHYELTRDLYGTSIARANYNVDEETPSFTLKLWEVPENYPLHFMSREDAENLLDQAIETSNKDAFGKAMHSFQDNFRHLKYEWPGFPVGHGAMTGLNFITFGLVNDPDAPIFGNEVDIGPDITMLMSLIKYRRKWNEKNPNNQIRPFLKDASSENEMQWLYDYHLSKLGLPKGAGLNPIADYLHKQAEYKNYMIIVDGVRYY